jgi:hypothetical protein
MSGRINQTEPPPIGPKLQLSLDLHKALIEANLPDRYMERMAAFAGYRLALTRAVELASEQVAPRVRDILREWLQGAS